MDKSDTDKQLYVLIKHIEFFRKIEFSVKQFRFTVEGYTLIRTARKMQRILTYGYYCTRIKPSLLSRNVISHAAISLCTQ